MSNEKRLLRVIRTISLVTASVLSVSATAGFLGFGSTSWKEEALLHDGSKIIVERSVERGGQHEIGQEPPFKNQSLTFTMPGTNQRVTWNDEYSEDIGTASFLPMQLEIFNGIPYIVASPMGCLSYNKWGRPNPPYVLFKYDGKAWQRITLQELPVESKMPNLVISSPDNAAKEASHGVVSAEKVKELNTGFQQPEYQTILREPVKVGTYGSSANCENLVYYKGAWVGTGDSIGKRMMDRMHPDKQSTAEVELPNSQKIELEVLEKKDYSPEWIVKRDDWKSLAFDQKRYAYCSTLLKPADTNLPQMAGGKFFFANDTTGKNQIEVQSFINAICDENYILFIDYNWGTETLTKYTTNGNLLYKIYVEIPDDHDVVYGSILHPSIRSANGYLYFQWLSFSDYGMGGRHVRRSLKVRLREPESVSTDKTNKRGIFN